MVIESRNLIRKLICVFTALWPLFTVVKLQADDSTASAETPADGARFFDTQVLPILRAHCHSCHAPQAGHELESGFDLTTRETLLRGGDSGPAVDESNLADSALLRAIRYEDLEMPPKGKLPQSQIDILTRWVEMGAPWGDSAAAATHTGPPKVDDHARAFWSFQPIRRPEVPVVANASWVKNPVDAFLLSKMEAAGLAPAPSTQRTTLLRRVYYDLIGLPPTPDEVREFLADDSPDAYERVVDRLLASPQYGERWGRHWLDLVRYAETNGYEFDSLKPEVWRYRDYVIDSFNADKPYDQFIREQLAGDELGEDSPEAIIATGYYRLGAMDGGAPDRLQAEFDELDDIMATTCQVFLGLTINCARCHDHKIDPLPTEDYYRMLAFFRGIRRGVRGSTRPIGMMPGQVAENPRDVANYRRQVREVERQIKTIEDSVVPYLVGAEVDDFKAKDYRPPIVRNHSPKDISAQELDRYEHLLRDRQRLEENRPNRLARALCVSERGPDPPTTHVLLRGSPYAEGDEVEPGFPSVITAVVPTIPDPDDDAESSGRRRVLAEWIASPDNPLTARVIANRLWHYHFNRGLVRSTSDFGYGGTPPTHPELLDWLATELVANDWRLKPMHKLMVMSSAYQMSSVDSPEAAEKDIANDLLTHFELRRLGAEEIRDTVLLVSGNFNPKRGGPSIFPTIAKDVLAGQSRPGQGWGRSTAEEEARRSVYIHVKRSLSVPLLAVFDAADTDSSCPVRFATTQPTQALTMLNSEFLNKQAGIFATDVRELAPDDTKEQVRIVLNRVTQREPTNNDIQRGVDFISRMQNEHEVNHDLALQKFCLLAMNLNESLYID
jgi:mono/diheme cytochrome c family protein